MRRALAIAIAALGPMAALLAGCGTPFPLPTETPGGRLLPSDNSYQMSATWEGMSGIADILLTQGPGTQLFLLFQHDGIGTARRGDVLAFALKARPPVPAPLPGIDFQGGLFVPAALCAGNGFVFVLDQGDTALARDQVSGRISDLSTYWRVRQYGLLGGDTVKVAATGGGTFTDTSLAFVRGIAADQQGRVYVSGAAIVLIPDPQDPRILTRTFQSRIFRYLPVAPGSVAQDPYMPGTNRWVKDKNFIVEEGSGLGTVFDVRGIYWGPGGPGTGTGSTLLAADFGKNWGQSLSDVISSTGKFKMDAAQDTSLNGPTDLAADLAGFIYICDTGNRRVLRFDPYGEFVQRVDVELDSNGRPLVEPIAVAADDSLVYVADRFTNQVVRYQRRK
jgi:hypothetical protein